MAHVRRQIRDAVHQRLLGLPSVGNRVFKSRAYPLDRAQLPGLILYTATEDDTAGTLDIPPEVERTMTLVVHAIAGVVPGEDDALDDLIAEVETALPSAAGIDRARALHLQGIQTQFDGSGERPLAHAAITFAVRYRTLQGSPEQAL